MEQLVTSQIHRTGGLGIVDCQEHSDVRGDGVELGWTASS